MELVSQREVSVEQRAPWDSKPRQRRNRRRRDTRPTRVGHAPDMEQIIQDQSRALQMAAIRAPPAASDTVAELNDSDVEIGSLDEMLSDTGSSVLLAVTLQTADGII
ncbi:hypothetical protein NDU88_004336 [Pleurodeles waltl]|uniref:Uncharacterized protein n=1 Tax=Pleurodeles waltl TaxID=8319 RepID=A0AAV7NN85_PLEWA|nr:hypothetical protein NDU88_004336 [Pleurodeles waltl]